MSEKHNFSRVTRLWISVLSFLGLSCVTEDENFTYKISYYKVFISTSLCVVLCVIFYYQIIIFFSYKGAFSSVALRCYVYCSGNLASIILMLIIITNAKATAQVLSEVALFNRKYQWTVYMSKKLFLSLILSKLMLAINFLTDYFQYVYGSDEHEVRYLLLGYIFPIFTIITVGQICFQLKWLDEYLEKFIEILENFSSPKEFLTEVSFTKLSGMWLKHSQMWQDELKTQELIELRSVYHQLYEIAKKTNRTNSARFFLTIGQNFTIGTLYMYFALVILVSPPQPLYTPNWCSYLRWSLSSYISILLIIYPCQTITDKAKKIISVVQKLRIKADKPKLMKELENFTIQLMEEKIEFSANGFFKINNSLLLSLLSAAASYLIILIQYRVTID